MFETTRISTSEYLKKIGVAQLPPCTSPFDPGYDPATLESHLEQSSHLMSILKVSMACWMVAKESATRQKVAAAKRHQVPTVTGGGPFEIAVGFTRIECGEGFTDMPLEAKDVVQMARQRSLDVQFELGKKHAGSFTEEVVQCLVEQGQRWLDAGALQLVVEGRESAKGVGLFDDQGNLNRAFADRFVEAFGFQTVIFEAPNKPSQFALLDHFGREVHLCNVRLEELLRVEIYRRGLHSDAFAKANLRPLDPSRELAQALIG